MKLNLKPPSSLSCFAGLFLLSTLLLASCTVSSPINTTKQFLSLWQKEQYEQTSSLIVKISDSRKIENLSDQEKAQFIENTKKKGKLVKFNVQNAVPLNNDILEKLGTPEGYEVFFYTETEKQGAKNNKYYLLKVDGQWRILPSID